MMICQNHQSWKAKYFFLIIVKIKLRRIEDHHSDVLKTSPGGSNWSNMFFISRRLATTYTSQAMDRYSAAVQTGRATFGCLVRRLNPKVKAKAGKLRL